MTVAKRVSESFAALLKGDTESALLHICAAIEATARLEAGAKGKKGYKHWVRSNTPLITAVGIGPALAGLRIAYSHPELPPSQDGSHDLGDLIYHVVRCSLYHEGALPDNVQLTDNQIGSNPSGDLLLPRNIVLGLLVAVVASKANVGLNIDPGHYFTAHGKRFVLTQYRGRRSALTKELRTLYAALRLGS